MKEQLISYETDKLAKEKGFVNLKKVKFPERREYYDHKFEGIGEYYYVDVEEEITVTPTQSLLQKWLREIHNIEFDIIVTKIGENKKSYDIFIIDTSKVEIKQNKKVIYSFFDFKNYEEVLEMGLNQALKLI